MLCSPHFGLKSLSLCYYSCSPLETWQLQQDLSSLLCNLRAAKTVRHSDTIILMNACKCRNVLQNYLGDALHLDWNAEVAELERGTCCQKRTEAWRFLQSPSRYFNKRRAQSNRRWGYVELAGNQSAQQWNQQIMADPCLFFGALQELSAGIYQYHQSELMIKSQPPALAPR